MKLLRTAVASLVLMSAAPYMHAQDRDRDKDKDRDRNQVVDRDHDRDRDQDRERFRSNDAAYQDGWNRGMTDGQQHHKSKIKPGHWKNQDREAYAAGYNRAYQSYYTNNNNNRRDRDHDRDHDHR